MTRKFIFLDFDGVLNDPYYLCFVRDVQDKWGEFDMKRVAILKYICDRTGAELVLTSSWNMRKGVKEFFESQGFIVADSLGWYQQRGKAICDWLQKYCANRGDGERMRYAILDDEKSDYYENESKGNILWLPLDKHLFFTGSNEFRFWTKESIKCAPLEIGLNRVIADKIVEYLNQ